MYLEKEYNSEWFTDLLTKIGGQEMIIETLNKLVNHNQKVIKDKDFELKLKEEYIEFSDKEIRNYESFVNNYPNIFKN